jgi:hypothetical protein
MAMSGDVTVGTSTLGRVWACLEAAGTAAETGRRGPGPVWELVCTEIREAQEYLERIDPDAVAVEPAVPAGEPFDLVRRALELLDDVDPYEQGVEVIALRVRVRWVERLMAPEADSEHF